MTVTICPTCGALERDRPRRRSKVCRLGHPAVRLVNQAAKQLDDFLEAAWRLGLCKKFHWNDQVVAYARDHLGLEPVPDPMPVMGFEGVYLGFDPGYMSNGPPGPAQPITIELLMEMQEKIRKISRR